MTSKFKLIGSAATMEGAERILSQYFYGSAYSIKIIEPKLWEVFSYKGTPAGILIKHIKNRFRIEEF